MADDKSNCDGQDRSYVSGDAGYEVEYFARKHRITKAQFETLIGEQGNSRRKLDAAAEKSKGQ